MARIFLTGASGYIGGDILYLLNSNSPQYSCAVLLRDEKKAEIVSKAYPHVRVVLADLDAVDVIEEEARQADVVIHAANNKHMKSCEAIARGLTNPSRALPGYWIQVSGASVLSIPDILNQSFGEKTGKQFDDIKDAAELCDIIAKNADTRMVDDYLQRVQGIKTALVFPPIIYGQGRGPIKPRSNQVPELARVAIQTRQTVQVGKGESVWSNIYIDDLSRVFVALAEKAVQRAEGALWNENGLYLVGNKSRISFGKISQMVAKSAFELGFTDSADVKVISPNEADKLTGRGSVFWGSNAKQFSSRSVELLGWVPTDYSLEQDIPEIVKAEAAKLGVL